MTELELKQEVERQFNILKRGSEEIISEEDLKKKLENSIKNNKPLKIKLGIDPSGTELHIGHAIPLRKMKQFQDLGHEIIVVVGTFTGKIGDPTGKSETRKMLTDEDVRKNISTYLDQLKLIIDIDKARITYNHEWLEILTLEDVLKLLTHFTVSQMTSREDFAKRLSENKPVSLIEFMYPILQGYDSVALNADVELGATEQRFNLLRGRDLQKVFSQEQQVCFMLPILEGLDGVEKMSKSLNNYIAVNDTPNDMFGKIMSISDNLMLKYYEQITEIPLDEIEQMKKDINSNELHPMEAKKRLAEELVKIYYGEAEGKKSREWFENVFSKKNLNVDLPEVSLEKEEVTPVDLLVKKLNLLKTTSEARRLIEQGGFKINDETIKDLNTVISIENDMIVRAGKKKIVKIVIK